ncbi:hypothetical protein [Nocardia barduliensis]|uniref:hypothetical protein n=1 Tax=Nocardia barduliensis TaxID=2736643 RepID=UPI0015721CAC|nr:hypothetical protein [Nocardia barduliensis]
MIMETPRTVDGRFLVRVQMGEQKQQVKPDVRLDLLLLSVCSQEYTKVSGPDFQRLNGGAPMSVRCHRFTDPRQEQGETPLPPTCDATTR